MNSRPLGVELAQWGWRHAGRAAWAVQDVSVTIEAGERVLLLGASGAGKSTMLQAMAGVLGGAEEGEEAGAIRVDGVHPTQRRGHIGLVMQDPSSQIVSARGGDDVAFGLENLGVPRAEIWPRVQWALDQVDLQVALDRSTTALSSGQAQRLTIAGCVAMGTGLVLLDEPTANLDPDGGAQVRETIRRLVADRSRTLVIVEHQVEPWLDLVDRVVVLGADGGLLADGAPDQVFTRHGPALADAGVWVPGQELPLTPLPTAPSQPEVLLTGRDLVVGHRPGQPVRGLDHVEVCAGVSTTLTGPNGTGKTTLALTLAGLLAPLGGSVEASPALRPSTRRGWFGRRRPASPHPVEWASRDLLTRIGTVFADPEHQLVTGSVREELAIGLRAIGHGDVPGRVDELLGLLHLEKVADANPFTLSGGEKRRLSVATVLATAPSVIVLDEPTFGQDRRTWIDLVELVQQLVREGRAVLSATHDAAYRRLLTQQDLELVAA